MWVALALPGMHLVPGLNNSNDASVSISLQSALLGIDDHTTSTTMLSQSLLRKRARTAHALPLLVPLDAQLQAFAVAPTESPTPDATSPTTVGLASSPVTSPPPASSDAPPSPSAPPSSNDAPGPAPPAPKHTPPPSVTPPASQPLPQAIAFTSTAPGDATVGGASYDISAVADSGLPVVFSVDPVSVGVCVVIGTTVLPLGEGTCVIDANQPGDDTYAAAAQVQQSFVIRTPARTQSGQSISFLSTPPGGVVVGGGPYVLSASASSGLPITYSTSAGSADVCHLVNGAVWFVGAGTCRIYADQAGDAVYLAAPQAQQWFTVNLVPQTIVFTSTAPSSATVGDPPYTVSAAAGSGLPVVFSADPSSAAVCTVSGASVVVVGAGTCVVDASQFGNLTYAAAQVQQSFTVAGGAPSQSVQTIQFGSVPPSTAVVGGTPYTLGATASSGLPVTFSADASSAGVCSVAGTTVTFTGAGTCAVDADQSGNASYLAAPQAQQSFAVTLVPQAISFTSSPPAAALVGDPAYTIAASASSGLAVTFSLAAGSAGVCTLTGSSVSFVGAGTCTIDADQPGDVTYQAAAQVQQSFAVVAPSASPQSITFTSTPPAAAAVGAAYSVSAAASSGLAVAFTIDASSAGVCSATGSSVSFTGTGTCTIDADQAGDANYQAAPQQQQSFAVGLASQAISFTSAAPTGVVAGDPAYTVTASSTSGLPVVFSADSSSAGVCTVSGSSVSFVGTGTCTIDADQPGNGTYAAAARVQQSFGVGQPSAPSVQTITFTSTPPSAATVGGAAYTVSAVASSGLAVVFSADSASAGVCTVSGSTVTPVAAGTCTIDADQPGNADYEAAARAQQSFTVGLDPQTISFTSTPPAAATVGGAGYAVSAAASSGLSVSFSIAAAGSGVCSISGTTVSFTGAGTCTVNADQSGNATYAAAAQAQQSFTVSNPSKSSQTITFTSSAPSSASVGGVAYHVTATASSGLAVSFSIAAGSAGVCSISGSTVSFTGSGTCVVDADQSGNASYLAAPQAQQSFAVGLNPQTISFTSTAPGSAVVGGATYTVAATASSGLAVTFSIAAGSAGVCTISQTTVSMTGGGTCVVNADQAGNSSYAAAQVQQSFAVAKGSQTITFTSTPGKVDKSDPPYIVSATATSGLAVTFTTDPSSNGICSVSGSTVSFQGRGTCIVYANQAGNGSWLPAPQTQQVFDIKNHTPG
jgi:hypothetical protein